ncbi:histone-lysine N-methyltransferase CLF-like isoform X1 [Hordeum vulgare subsp. vulgare]|uniref:histone-lysine N-methyltransferase CLF-like isoform X1 n=1 Tax=Hordeum vulgare subsp. vulgare TaxID=112509 RepID=UPI001D1A5776|nr:histone-lysine N-methyltransferase CLF-like isoform X1 [Hordeum vulgare subsp. vulgare]
MPDEEGTEASRLALASSYVKASSYVNALKKEFTTYRSNDIKDMIEKNKIKLSTITQSKGKSSIIWQTSASDGTDLAANLLTPRQDDAPYSMHGLELCLVEEDCGSYQEESPHATSTVTLGGNLAAKNSKKPIELPEVSKFPRYTTWTFVDRNQKMTEDQSAFDQKNIYYNADCGEALMFSDSEDEVVEDEEKKREFNSSEDNLIRTTIEDTAMSDAVLEALAQCCEKTAGDIKARYEIVKGENTEGSSKQVSKLNAKLKDVYHDKDLDAALDSFNNLFCRRCLVFDCKLHGCSQDLIFPAEKQSPWNSMDDVPCGIHCYKLATKHKDSVASSQNNSPSARSSRKKDAHQMQNNSALVEDRNYLMEETHNEQSATDGHDSSTKEELVDKNICTQEDNLVSWKVIEQELLVKGVEIFGRNSCLIARNLLGGEKMCSDVFQYMNYIENSSTSEGHDLGRDLGLGSRFPGKRGKVRRVKRIPRSTVYRFIRKRIAARKDELRQHYNPCGCQLACGKQCPCQKNGTCCEKFCGCPEACRNRFLGCKCAKAQCRSRQCPCFAADRECDPDMCIYCGVGCGEGSLGVPNQRGDNYGCQNMKLLLRQQQKVVLGRSDVSGWGAFVKLQNTVGKDECLGEYTGELISHREAAKRGQRYDRENSSFLFNLNNEFVLDAFRMGNKLKFANHSPDPNCYAKVMLVAGDHRVGIFANERINAGEEIFYDYHYAPEEAPAWALKADDATGPEDPGQSSSGSAKKANAPGAKDPGQSSRGRAKRPGQSSRGRPRKHAK